MNEQAGTLTEGEFCLRVGISRVTAWRLREQKKLSYCKIGKKIFYLPRHVDQFLNSCEQPAKQREPKEVK